MKFSKKNIEAGLNDVIQEAGLKNVAWVEIVDINERLKFAVALDNNLERRQPTEDQVQRLKEAFPTTVQPTWFYVAEYYQVCCRSYLDLDADQIDYC